MKVRNLLLGSMVFLNTCGFGALDLISEDEPIDLGAVTLGDLAFNGSGCTAGTVFPILDRTNQELVLVFDDYYVEAEGARRTARKNCSLAIPIKLPAGLGVTLIGQKVAGFNLLPDGASTVLSTETFIAGGTGDVVSTRFDGELVDDFLVGTVTPVISETPSICGTNANLRINTSLRVKTNVYGDYAGAAVTALGESARGLTLRMKFSHCQ